MKKKTKEKKRCTRVSIEDYERFAQSHPLKRVRRQAGLPARALSNPRLEQCKSFYNDKKQTIKKKTITDKLSELGRNRFRPFARIVYTPMGGSNISR